ncbi:MULTISPECIES: pyridoxal-dependent decarboxylase [unclassified Pseudonocardia]|uniref:pyridoxal-dependent decarboxylase n=1 Tax=unclassified Pseudonocardia TaxID=2619320 RepID=UPI000AD5EA8A|nr:MULTISPECIES: pyridoxal-dependent decarboxylase [unclassified Pseudonocardia]
MPDLTPDEFRALGHLFVDAVADSRAGLHRRPVRDVVEPGTVRARFDDHAAEAPSPLAAFPSLVETVTGDAETRWQHPGFHAFFPANASLTSLLGELLSGSAGAQGMLWSTSPACTEVEQAITDQLARALGLAEEFTHDGGGGGVIQDSASSASLVALLAALHRAAPGPDDGWRARGVTGRERVYVTAETHSSLAKAVRTAGLGARGLRTVPCTTGTASMDPEALRVAMAEDAAAGLLPVMVCATVGTTSTGASDPVGPVAAVAAEHRAWVHVDAAWAGVAALCEEHRWVVDGADRADSFCTDAHKWLLTAFDASLLWVRDASALPAALSIAAPYLRDAASDSGAVVDYRDWQVPLGRRFRALKLWAVLHGQGLSGLRAPAGARRAGRRAGRTRPRSRRPRPGRRARARPGLPARDRHRLGRGRRRGHPDAAGRGERDRPGPAVRHRRRRATGDPGGVRQPGDRNRAARRSLDDSRRPVVIFPGR